MTLPLRDKPYHVDIVVVELIPKAPDSKVQAFAVKMLVEKRWVTSNIMLPHAIVEIQDAVDDLTGKTFKFIMRDVPFGQSYHIDASTKFQSDFRVKNTGNPKD